MPGLLSLNIHYRQEINKMKSMLLSAILMLCVFNDSGYANETILYNYPPSPVVVNVPQLQTTWIPVTTVVNQPVVYYPYYVWPNVGVTSTSWGIVEKQRCLFAPQRYYINYGSSYQYQIYRY